MDHHFNSKNNSISAPTNRIQYDILCQVCQDYSSGKHYGVFCCDGCAGFFKRSVRGNRKYFCRAKDEGACLVDRTNRNRCRACRLRKCLQAGMIEDTVQEQRGPRRSTLLRRQTTSKFNDFPITTAITPSHHNTDSSENGDDTSPPTSVSSGRPTPSPESELTTSPELTVSPVYTPVTMMTTLSNSQLPSIAHRPHIIDSLPSTERAPLGTRSEPLLCAPKPKYAQSDVPITIPMPQSSSLEAICESASRLLFMNIRWAKSIPVFTTLPSRDQITLLQDSWREFFVLGAAQFALPIEADTLMTAVGFGCTSSSVSSERQLSLLDQIQTFQETVVKFKEMNVDPTEYACLRAVTLFKTSAGLIDIPSTSNLQDQAQLTLSRYVSTTYPTQQLRFGRLLLLLPALRAIATSTIEELFFRKTIGNTSIERIVIDVYKSGDF